MVVPPLQFLGNVDLALSEIRSLQNEEDRGEALIRRMVRSSWCPVLWQPGGQSLRQITILVDSVFLAHAVKTMLVQNRNYGRLCLPRTRCRN